jgi:hypothetical protein
MPCRGRARCTGLAVRAEVPSMKDRITGLLIARERSLATFPETSAHPSTLHHICVLDSATGLHPEIGPTGPFGPGKVCWLKTKGRVGRLGRFLEYGRPMKLKHAAPCRRTVRATARSGSRPAPFLDDRLHPLAGYGDLVCRCSAITSTKAMSMVWIGLGSSGTGVISSGRGPHASG